MASTIIWILLFIIVWSILMQYIIVIKMFFKNELITKKEFLGGLIPLLPLVILFVSTIIKLIGDGKKAWKKLK
jgi:hypothetical protein